MSMPNPEASGLGRDQRMRFMDQLDRVSAWQWLQALTDNPCTVAEQTQLIKRLPDL